MIVVDVETTGTEAQKHSLVSIGAVDFVDPKRQFYGECRIWDGAHVMEEALAINGYSEESVKDPSKKTDRELVEDFLQWASESQEHTFAGQNPSFDVEFIKQTAIRYGLNFSLPNRSIDQHTLTFMHMIKRGLKPPVSHKRSDINSDFIMEYVGIPTEPKPHNALNGAVWEAEALSRLLYDRNLLDQFAKFPIPWLNAS